MKINQMAELILIRNYIANSIDNHNFKRDKVNQLNNILITLDKNLTDEIISDKFKSNLNLLNVEDAVKEVIDNNNLKREMKASNKIVTVEEGKVEVR